MKPSSRRDLSDLVCDSCCRRESEVSRFFPSSGLWTSFAGAMLDKLRDVKVEDIEARCCTCGWQEAKRIVPVRAVAARYVTSERVLKWKVYKNRLEFL